MLFSVEDKNNAFRIVSSLVFWLGYLATRYAGPSVSEPTTAAHPPRRVISEMTRRAITLWCFIALAVNISYFSVAMSTRKTPADVSARLWFCATQLFSASYNVWQELHIRDALPRPLNISAQATRDGAYLPILCMAADFIAREGARPSLREVAYYSQSALWLGLRAFVTSVQPA